YAARVDRPTAGTRRPEPFLGFRYEDHWPCHQGTHRPNDVRCRWTHGRVTRVTRGDALHRSGSAPSCTNSTVWSGRSPSSTHRSTGMSAPLQNVSPRSLPYVTSNAPSPTCDLRTTH